MPIIESSPLLLLIWLMIGYAIGSVPFGMLVAKQFKLGNLRDIGSGNIGATNVLRTGNKGAAALTLLLDAAKGAAAVLLGRYFVGEDATQVAALGAFLGHCFPLWLNFKGGKGVATFIGIMLALNWAVGVVTCIAWLCGAAITRMSSVGALMAAAASTFAMVIIGQGSAVLLGGILTLFIYWTHRANIQRIRAGTESKIGQKG
jgi:glycerol-3-phosphate acyltransferase PlsY